MNLGKTKCSIDHEVLTALAYVVMLVFASLVKIRPNTHNLIGMWVWLKEFIGRKTKGVTNVTAHQLLKQIFENFKLCSQPQSFYDPFFSGICLI